MGFGSILGSVGGFALGGPLGASIGGSLGGLIDGNAATGKAQRAQQQSVAEANKLQREQFEYQKESNAPMLQARNASLAKMQELLGITPGSNPAAAVASDPGYQFGLQQGQQALQRQAAARGMLNSGAALKAATRYGTDYGTTKFNDSFNRYATTAGFGQQGANNLAGAGQNYANTVGNNLMSMGNANAAAGLANNALQSQTANQLGGWLMNKGPSLWGGSGSTNLGGSAGQGNYNYLDFAGL